MRHAIDTPNLSIEMKTAAAFRWLNKRAAPEWHLTQDDMAALLGGMPRRTLQKHIYAAEADQPVSVTRDVSDRLSILLGIWAALGIFAPAGSEQSFFTRPYNAPPLNGRSIKEVLVNDGSLIALHNMRRWLNAKRG